MTKEESKKKKEKRSSPGRSPSKVTPLIETIFGILGIMLIFSILCDKGYIFPRSKKKKNSHLANFKKFEIPEYLWTANETVTPVRTLKSCIQLCTFHYPVHSAFVYNEPEQICHLGNATIQEIERKLIEESQKSGGGQKKTGEEEEEETVNLCQLFVLNPENMTLPKKSAETNKVSPTEGDIFLDLSKEIPPPPDLEKGDSRESNEQEEDDHEDKLGDDDRETKEEL